MRGKNLFKTIFIIALVVWALYALWPTYKLQTLTTDESEQLDEEGRLVSLRNKAIRMGLDLQGGMYLTYEVDLPQLVEQLARNKDDQLISILQKTREELNVSTENFLDILERCFEEEEIPLNRYWGERGDSDSKVLDELRNEAIEAVDRSLQKLRNRIDQFGVSEPSIQKVRDRRILIELPGVSNPDDAKALIGRTALLEFKLLKDNEVFTKVIDDIDKALARSRGVVIEAELPDTTEVVTVEEVVEQKESNDEVISVNELFGEEEILTTESEEADTALLVDREIFEENPFIALLRDTRQAGKLVSVPIENIKAVDKILEREDIQSLIPPDAQFLWSSETFRIGDQEYRELFIVNNEAELTGRYITDARVTIGSDVQSAGMPEVNFALNRSGATIFSRVTGANLNKRLAIVLDNRVVSAPNIQTKIPDGRGRITGIGEMDEAQMLAIVLRVGALDAPIQIVEERTVGPSLGRDSITRGQYSIIIGMIIVILFMMVYYRMAGVIANFALIFNLVLLMAVLAQFGFVLTLPGVAGIVLTIGMAVDANVLVFERIREELRTGKTVRASIDAGYSRAFKAIFDANVTTLLTALVLYQFGTGPVKGFAVTLSIGVIISMFTALVVTRVIFDYITSRRVLTKLSI
ncbi:protein translocase subunit SecD [bacterium]|nr:protein translocase subunit SecD [bacterium]